MADQELALQLEEIREEAAELRKCLTFGFKRQESHFQKLEHSNAELSAELRWMRQAMFGKCRSQRSPPSEQPWQHYSDNDTDAFNWPLTNTHNVLLKPAPARLIGAGPVAEGTLSDDEEPSPAGRVTAATADAGDAVRIQSVAKELKRVQAIIDRLHVVQDSGEQLDELSGSFKSASAWNLVDRAKQWRATLTTPIHPHSRFRTNWDLLLLLLLLYVCITAPVLVCFDISLGPGDGLWYFETFVTIMFVLDILLNFNTAFLDYDGKLVTNRWRIVYVYSSTWLIIDLLAVIPFDLLPSGDEFTELEGVQLAKGLRLAKFTRILRVLRVVKLLRLLKVLKLPELMRRMPSFSGTNVMRLIIVVGSAILLLHLSACGFHYVAHLKRQDNQFELYEHDMWKTLPSEGGWSLEKRETLNKETWEGTWVWNLGLTQSDSKISRYITSLYWAMSTLTTVGYGDVTPQNDTERLVAMFAMVIGVTVFAYFMGSTASLISAGNATEAAVAQRLGQMREFLNVRRVPPMLREKIQNFYTSAARHQVLQDEDVIHHLSAPLQTELMLFLYRNTLEKVPFFQGQDPHFITALVKRLKLEYYAEGDVVVAEEDLGTAMYFVVTGQLEGRHYRAHKSEWMRLIKQQSMDRRRTEESESLLTKVKSGFGLDRAEKDANPAAGQWQFLPNAKALGNDYNVVSKLHPGQHFGEYGCLLGQPRSATIVALEFCELYSMTRDDLMECYEQWPKLHAEFLEFLRQFKALLAGGADQPEAAHDSDGCIDGGIDNSGRRIVPILRNDGESKMNSPTLPTSSVSFLDDTVGASAQPRPGKRVKSASGVGGSRKASGSLVEMDRAAELVVNMTELDEEASKNPVFQLLNNGHDLKGSIHKHSSRRQLRSPTGAVSAGANAAGLQPQASLPGTIEREIGAASETSCGGR